MIDKDSNLDVARANLQHWEKELKQLRAAYALLRYNRPDDENTTRTLASLDTRINEARARLDKAIAELFKQQTASKRE